MPTLYYALAERDTESSKVVQDGEAPRQSITPEWMNGVLAREIETANMAARNFRDEDLSEETLSDQYKEAEFYRDMAGYFESTLDHCGK